MSHKIEFLPRARKELMEAWDWYDDRWIGLGDRFMREVEKKVQQIEKTPERYAERQKGTLNAKKVFVRQKLMFSPILLYTGYKSEKRSLQ
jgi:hypothetical protein